MPASVCRHTLQLRTYTLRPGALEQWTTVWLEKIKPLRESLGFTVPAAWSVPEKNQFVWLLGYAGPEAWATLDAAFHASPERADLTPDPAGLIVEIVTCFVEPIV